MSKNTLHSVTTVSTSRTLTVLQSNKPMQCYLTITQNCNRSFYLL